MKMCAALNVLLIAAFIANGCAPRTSAIKPKVEPVPRAPAQMDEEAATAILESRAHESTSSWQTCLSLRREKSAERALVIAVVSPSGEPVNKWAVSICRRTNDDTKSDVGWVEGSRGQLENELGERGRAATSISPVLERPHGAVFTVSVYRRIGSEHVDFQTAVPVIWLVNSEFATRDGYRILVTFE